MQKDSVVQPIIIRGGPCLGRVETIEDVLNRLNVKPLHIDEVTLGENLDIDFNSN